MVDQNQFFSSLLENQKPGAVRTPGEEDRLRSSMNSANDLISSDLYRRRSAMEKASSRYSFRYSGLFD